MARRHYRLQISDVGYQMKEGEFMTQDHIVFIVFVVLWILISALVTFIYESTEKAIKRHRQKKKIAQYVDTILEERRRREFFERYLRETRDL